MPDVEQLAVTGRRIDLTPQQRAELEELRDRSKKPYLRERAAAILKVADGQWAAEVARSGLLKRRDTDTLYSWLARFETEGVPGLYARGGRGRKPAFSP